LEAIAYLDTAMRDCIANCSECQSVCMVTVRHGSKTPPNWSRFRPDNILGEGSANVRLADASEHLSFRTGRGLCVIERYATSKAAHRENACLVAGAGSSAVVVSAAPTRLRVTAAQPDAWWESN
jgi:hypothetical protein